MSFNAYVHCRPDGTPFYVGKGTVNRAKKIFRDHNPGHVRIVKECGASNILVGILECSDEETAFLLERGLIKRLRKMGVCIVNLTEGGEGTSGVVVSKEARESRRARMVGNRYGEALKGVPKSKSCREKMSKSHSRREAVLARSKMRGGTPVSCTNGKEWLTFETVADACRELGLYTANVSRHLRRTGKKSSTGVKGWFFQRIADGR